MSPRLKPLLLPQLVQERLNNHGDAAYMPYNGLDAIDLSQVY